MTQFLGYNALQDEGKVMGLAPYGSPNSDIRERLESVISVDADYDVTAITKIRNDSITLGVRKLESLFGRKKSDTSEYFSQWEKDLAYTTQNILEEIVTAIISHYLSEHETKNICLAGGIALNCKMNKQIMELKAVDQLYVQPVAHDGGSILGAAASIFDWDSVSEIMTYTGAIHFKIRRLLAFLTNLT